MSCIKATQGAEGHGSGRCEIPRAAKAIMPDQTPAALRRRLTLPLLVLYGTGVTVGAGIYVLIGPVAGHAGAMTPWAFVLAASTMALTVASYAELCTRFPVAASEAAYVRAAFRRRSLSAVTGLITIVIGIVSSAAVAVGAAGYVEQIIDAPRPAIIVGLVLLLGAFAAWGILESVLIAGAFTLIEVGGLMMVIAAGWHADLPMASTLLAAPSLTPHALSGLLVGSLLAFFAFIGFESLANVAEEAHLPEKNLPRAMAMTLAITTTLYLLVAAIAVTAVAPARLAASPAPLGLIYREVAGASPLTINLIAIVATLNTILAQITVAARVVYGMARQGDLPRAFARVNAITATPLVATALVTAIVLALASTVSLEGLAEFTSIATLIVFAMVNLALLKLRLGTPKDGHPHFKAPLPLVVAGLISCMLMIATAFL